MYALLLCKLQTCMQPNYTMYNQFIHDFEVEMNTLLKFTNLMCTTTVRNKQIGNNFLVNIT